MRRERRVALGVVGACVVVAAVGFVAGARLESPDDAARRSRAPEPSVLTAPVERRALTSDLVTRGDVAFSEAAEVAVDPDLGAATEAGGGLVVTGKVPAEGTTVTEGSVVLEVSGRPVIVLAGDLPMYRAIRPDSSGPDVAQFEAALARLGHDPGPVDGHYDKATEAAVGRLYAGLGYEAVRPTEDERSRLDAAEQQVAAARSAARQADDAAALPEAPPSVAAAQADAYDAYDRAVRNHQDAQRAIGVRVPRGEVVFVPSLPRQVQRATAAVGRTPDDAVVTLAGGVPRASVEVGAATRQQLRVGGTVRLDDAGVGVTAEGRIASVADTAGTDGANPGQYRVWIVTEDPAAARLVGLNVRVTVPLAATDGTVLAVPAAAVFTRADGQAYVQVVGRSDRTDGGAREVPVTTGLSAQGLVEVRPGEGALAEGDEVVIGVR